MDKPVIRMLLWMTGGKQCLKCLWILLRLELESQNCDWTFYFDERQKQTKRFVNSTKGIEVDKAVIRLFLWSMGGNL